MVYGMDLIVACVSRVGGRLQEDGDADRHCQRPGGRDLPVAAVGQQQLDELRVGGDHDREERLLHQPRHEEVPGVRRPDGHGPGGFGPGLRDMGRVGDSVGPADGALLRGGVVYVPRHGPDGPSQLHEPRRWSVQHGGDDDVRHVGERVPLRAGGAEGGQRRVRRAAGDRVRQVLRGERWGRRHAEARQRPPHTPRRLLLGRIGCPAPGPVRRRGGQGTDRTRPPQPREPEVMERLELRAE